MAFDSLYSALIIEANDGPSDWRLFEYSLSQPIAGQRRAATRAHTNLYRAGDVGLQRGAAAQICRWRASSSIRLQDPLLDWAAEAAVEFHYDLRLIASSPLLDILMAPQPILGDGNCLNLAAGYRGVVGAADVAVFTGRAQDGLLMREMIGFYARIYAPSTATNKLREWLVSMHNAAEMTLWIWLEGVIVRPVQ